VENLAQRGDVERFIRCSVSSTGVSFGANEGQYVQPDIGNFLFCLDIADDTLKLNALLEKSNNV
jgi:hypothetical protein